MITGNFVSKLIKVISKYDNYNDLRNYFIKKHKHSFDDISDRLCNYKLRKKTFRTDRDSFMNTYCKKNINEKPKTNKEALNHFKSLYDKDFIIPKIIESKIKTVLKNKGWMTDQEFRMECDVKLNDWFKYKSNYEKLQLRIDKKLIWGHPDIIEDMKKITDKYKAGI